MTAFLFTIIITIYTTCNIAITCYINYRLITRLYRHEKAQHEFEKKLLNNILQELENRDPKNEILIRAHENIV